MKKWRDKNMGTPNDLIEFGKVLITWGFWIMVYGLATMAIGFGLILIGKVFFEEKTELILATISHLLNN